MENKPSNQYLILLNMGWVIAASMTAFLWGGLSLDKRYGTSPLFILLGVLLAFCASGLTIYQTLKKLTRDAPPKPER